MTAEPVASDLGADLSDLWSAETCGWHVDYDGGAGSVWPWTVILEWSSERGNPHSADWVTYTWQFYGETIDRALSEAVEWCEGLVPWEPCGECDGTGSWNGRDPCGDCQATGLANHG